MDITVSVKIIDEKRQEHALKTIMRGVEENEPIKPLSYGIGREASRIAERLLKGMKKEG